VCYLIVVFPVRLFAESSHLVCFVAKRYTPQQKCLKKSIGSAVLETQRWHDFQSPLPTLRVTMQSITDKHTDRQTDRRQYHAKSRWSAKKQTYATVIIKHCWLFVLTTSSFLLGNRWRSLFNVPLFPLLFQLNRHSKNAKKSINIQIMQSLPPVGHHISDVLISGISPPGCVFIT